ncbi:MAG: Sir2 silent information regulator family NAD-dependent deacetylase [Eubacteriales bacterium]|nr:Sir2 silent information regulator family NAD-dependent deacetylase [Eubacteriales bacterium]
MAYMDIVQEVTGKYEEEIERLKKVFHQADAIIVGAGSGLSTSAGLDFAGERLQQLFGDFVEKYGITDMYTGCFTPFESREERWAYWARWAWYNRFLEIPKNTLQKLLALLSDKDYFVLTTNIDHTFIRAGFPKERLCYTQGDFGLFQCSKPCHKDTYDNYDILKQMIEQEKDMKVPTELIPHCPKCGREMDFNLFWDDTFVRDKGWHKAHERYEKYLAEHKMGKILYLELGVGYNSPGVIKIPFWQMTAQNPEATFASVNLMLPSYPAALSEQAIVISRDIDQVLLDLA